jgi:hypothetical protein
LENLKAKLCPIGKLIITILTLKIKTHLKGASLRPINIYILTPTEKNKNILFPLVGESIESKASKKLKNLIAKKNIMCMSYKIEKTMKRWKGWL